MIQTETHRLFFALWPSDEIREQIAQAFKRTPQSSMTGRRVAPSNYHITLHFIGNIRNEQQQCLHRAAQSMVTESFQLKLDKYGYFDKPRVFWMGCQHVPEPLKHFQQQLGEALSSCGYQPESRTYAPHVTLMRKLARPGELVSMTDILWRANEFVLVESTSTPEGVHYEVIEHYPFSLC